MESKKQNRWRRILRRAANLLERGNWVKRSFIIAKDRRAYTSPNELTLDADTFCVLGAVRQSSVTKDEPSKICHAGRIAEQKICNYSWSKKNIGITTFNDRQALDKNEVVNLLRECANAD
jgi:hypothetical protein